MAVEIKSNSLVPEYFGSLDKTIFESYTKVIECRIKSGRETPRLKARLELLLTNSK